MAAEMNAGHFEEISDCWSSEEQSTAYYRTTAARARRLQADATTPRVKQYLDKVIVHCERLAGNVPLDPQMAEGRGDGRRGGDPARGGNAARRRCLASAGEHLPALRLRSLG